MSNASIILDSCGQNRGIDELDNDDPVLYGIGGNPVTIAGKFLLPEELQDSLISGAQVILMNPEAGDTLSERVPQVCGISVDNKSCAVVRFLKGYTSAAGYEVALRSIRFSNRADGAVAGMREVWIVIAGSHGLPVDISIRYVRVLPTTLDKLSRIPRHGVSLCREQ